MAVRRGSGSEPQPNRRRPATTPEGRETQMIALAMDLAERQLLEGTASAQVVSQLLKLGSSRERLEQEKMRHENELLKVKKESLESQQRMEELYKEAMDAMSSYKGVKQDSPEDEYGD